MSGPSSAVLQCPKCKVGKLAKLPAGYTCDQCGFQPFARAPGEREPPPAPLIPRADADSRPYTPADLATDRPARVLFTSQEKRPESMRVQWADAGGGLLYAGRVVLQTLPPGETVPVQLLAWHRGTAPYRLEAFVRLSLPDGTGPTVRTSTGDLFPDHVLEAVVQVPPPPNADACRVTVVARAGGAVGQPHPPMVPLRVDPVAGDPGVRPTPTDAVVKFTSTPLCPRCENRMVWIPASPKRVRSWACDACGHRVDTGSLG